MRTTKKQNATTDVSPFFFVPQLPLRLRLVRLSTLQGTRMDCVQEVFGRHHSRKSSPTRLDPSSDLFRELIPLLFPFPFPFPSVFSYLHARSSSKTDSRSCFTHSSLASSFSSPSPRLSSSSWTGSLSSAEWNRFLISLLNHSGSSFPPSSQSSPSSELCSC